MLAGVALIVLEIFTPGFIVMWFGIAALVAAIPAYFGAPLSVVILVYAISVLALTILGQRIIAKVTAQSTKEKKTNVDALVGLEGVVVEEIDPIRGTGSVRVGREIWSAISHDGVRLAKDTVVVVHRVDGVKLVVTKEG